MLVHQKPIARASRSDPSACSPDPTIPNDERGIGDRNCEGIVREVGPMSSVAVVAGEGLQDKSCHIE